jgi:hypothetical protein
MIYIERDFFVIIGSPTVFVDTESHKVFTELKEYFLRVTL